MTAAAAASERATGVYWFRDGPSTPWNLGHVYRDPQSGELWWACGTNAARLADVAGEFRGPLPGPDECGRPARVMPATSTCSHDDPDNSGLCIYCCAILDPADDDPPRPDCGCPVRLDGSVSHWPDCTRTRLARSSRIDHLQVKPALEADNAVP